MLDDNVVDIPEIRNSTGVFIDRADAGRVLAGLMEGQVKKDAIVFAIPAGGVPVADILASKLRLKLDVAVVSKITLPWTSEAGYGAVAFDGTVQINQDMVSRLGLTQSQINEGVGEVSLKVQRRIDKFRGNKPFPNTHDHQVILVDDGIASGFTMLVAVEALKNTGAVDIIAASPTAHLQSLENISPKVSKIYCANIREGLGFAVAAAYQNWCDVDEQEVYQILNR